MAQTLHHDRSPIVIDCRNVVLSCRCATKVTIIVITAKFVIVEPVVEFLGETLAQVNKLLNVFKPILVARRLYHAVYIEKQCFHNDVV